MASKKDNSSCVLFSDRDNPAAILPLVYAALGLFGGGMEGGSQGTSAALRLSRHH